MTNTLAQDLAWERWEQCKGVDPEVSLREIRPDGQIWFYHGGSVTLANIERCLRQAAVDQAARAGRGAPAAVAAPEAVAAPAGAQTIVSAFTWHARDEWGYRYTSPTATGTYVWAVDRIETIESVECYVIRSETREMFHRRSDGALVLERVGREIVRRDTPPRMHFDWPLFVGKEWEQTLTMARPADKRSTTLTAAWIVEAEEVVAVPAGRFRTFKIVHRDKGTRAVIYEAWYAPAVNQWVKVKEFLTAGVRERELIAFRVAQPGAWGVRAVAPAATATSPSASPAPSSPPGPPAEQR